MADTYDPASIKLVIGGQLITDFMDGTFLTFAKDEDDWNDMAGADGIPARAQNRNEMGIVTFTLKQTSRSNNVLSAMRALDRTTRSTLGACAISDALSTTFISSDSCYVKKVADVEYAASEISGREWTLRLPRANVVVGGAYGIP